MYLAVSMVMAPPTFITVKCNRGFGAGGETRTHVGFPTAYKTVAIATMRLQHFFFFGFFRCRNSYFYMYQFDYDS